MPADASGSPGTSPQALCPANSGEQHSSCLDNSPSHPPFWPRTLDKSPHVLSSSSASAWAPALKRGHKTKDRNVQTGPISQHRRAHAPARPSSPRGQAFLAQESGLPPGRLCGPAWHLHPPSAKLPLKAGAWRGRPRSRAGGKGRHEEQGCVFQRESWLSGREPKVGDKPAHGLMTTGPVPGARVTVHPAWCQLEASARPPGSSSPCL